MTTEETIGNRILGRIDDLQANREITCSIAASHSITCDCGAVLDERTVCVLQHLESNHRVQDGKDWSCIVACCPDCQDSATGQVKKAIEKALIGALDCKPETLTGKWRWQNWTGETDI